MSDQKRDRILQAQAHGEAWRRLSEGEPVAAIVEEIRSMAGERVQLLVEAAGIGVGVWSARPMLPATELAVAWILLEAAGANDLDQLDHWVRVGRDRGLQPPHTASWSRRSSMVGTRNGGHGPLRGTEPTGWCARTPTGRSATA